MAKANAHIKKERKEMIDDLHRVFGPMDERVTKAWVTYVYDACYNVMIKQKPYVREAMSLAKVLAAQQLEKFITGEGEPEATEVAANSDEKPIGENAPVIAKTKFVD